MRSQLDPRKWYTLSLSCEWCECDDYGPICKHMWALKMIGDEEFPHLLDLLPSVYEPNGFMHPLDTYESCEDVNEGPSDGPNENPNTNMNGGPSDGADDSRYDLKEKLLKISNLTTLVRMETLTVEQYETINNVAESILATLQGVVDLAPRPIQIPMPWEGGSITPIQAHVTNTRLGHGRPNKKRKLNNEGLFGGENLLVRSPRLGGMKLVPRTQKVEKKCTQVKLPKLCKEACLECEDLNIFFNGINKVECRNCEHVIVRDGGSIVLEKEEYDENQDIELFFKELDIC